MNKINTVLFDFDGTIMDTNDIILNSWNFTFNKILGHDADEKLMLEHFGEPLALSMKIFFGAEDEIAVQEYIDLYRSYQRDHFEEDIKLFPGVTEMLDSLKKEGFTLALVTSRLKQTTMQGVEKFGLDRFFDVIVTANDCTKHKPDPQPVDITLEKLGKKPEEAVMVGDTRMDLGCASNAGVKSVLVGWSRALPPEKADKSGIFAPDFILYDPADMTGLLRRPAGRTV